MRFKLAIVAIALLIAGKVHADTITVNLGASDQNYALIGTGGSGGFGTYLAQQGNCFSGPSLTTCILTGNYSGTTSGFDAGTYTLTTTYNSTDGGLPATSTDPVNSPDGGNYFNFNPYAPDVNMNLFLVQTGGGANAVPIVENGAFVADSYFIGGTAPVCSNLPAGMNCTQGDIGLTNGGTFSGPITGSVIFQPNVTSSVVAAVPEPELLALGGMIPGVLLFARRRFLS